MRDTAAASHNRQLYGRGKKTAEAIHQEIAREVDSLLTRIFAEHRKTGRFDLEAIEMALRGSLHQAGAAALTELLHYPPPPAQRRSLPCPCGQTAPYRELRSKTVLTCVGLVELQRPYYLCPDCGNGQFPADSELDVENTGFSPGVRKMLALVGQAAPFDQGREQLRVLAALELTTKAVERNAEPSVPISPSVSSGKWSEPCN